jgi:hypothetical protein
MSFRDAKILVLAAALFVSGCKAPGFFIKKTSSTIREAQTNTVIVLRTNYLPTTVYVTNTDKTVSATVQQVATVQPALETRIMPAVVVTNLSLGDGVTSAVSVAGELAPVPWSGAAVQTLLALAGGVFGVVNHFRAKKALGEKASFATTAQVLIANVDHVREAAKTIPGYRPEWDEKVMAAIQAAQVISGTKATVADLVQKHDVAMVQVG